MLQEPPHSFLHKPYPLPPRARRCPTLRFLLVMTMPCLVHCLAASAVEGASERVPHEVAAEAPVAGKLPHNVAEMRDEILAAAAGGEIDELRVPIQWNELRPAFGEEAGTDPIAHLKRLAGDGAGREVLAAMVEILSLPAARVRTGRDIENDAVYVWPYLAERDLATLTPAEEVHLLRLVSPAEGKEMRANKKWTWWRLSIGADGTWLTFRKAD